MVQESNSLHLELIHLTEQLSNQERQSDRNLRKLEDEKKEIEFLNSQLSSKVSDLQLERDQLSSQYASLLEQLRPVTGWRVLFSLKNVRNLQPRTDFDHVSPVNQMYDFNASFMIVFCSSKVDSVAVGGQSASSQSRASCR